MFSNSFSISGNTARDSLCIIKEQCLRCETFAVGHIQPVVVIIKPDAFLSKSTVYNTLMCHCTSASFKRHGGDPNVHRLESLSCRR